MTRSGSHSRILAASRSRRDFLFDLGAVVGGVAFSGVANGLERGALSATPKVRVHPGHLRVGSSSVNLTGRLATGVNVNGSIPAPLLRFKEGDEVSLVVENALDVDTSIHWHGLILPANMDGVPGLSFNGIPPGGVFTYRFALRQHGTYWYHGHSAFQEQSGLYGPLIVDPLDPEPFPSARDYVVMLSDWIDQKPEQVFSRLTKHAAYYNFRQRTVADFIRDAASNGLGPTVRDRLAWGDMRMNPTDLSDVAGNAYTCLINGRTSAQNWTGLFKPGECLRLRFINGAAMTYFDVRIPGLRMTVIAADGQRVKPVVIDEFRLAVAETLDVLVTPENPGPYTIFAQTLDRTGFVRGTLATRDGAEAPVPPLDPRPLITMADMGHGNHGAHAAQEGDHRAAHGAGHQAPALQAHPDSETDNPLVDMQTLQPEPRLDDPGIGLRDNGRRVLAYADLSSVFEDPDGREPTRTIELHLTGHMEKFIWSFDGRPFSDATPLRLTYGERVRLVLVNDTMMSHPIHLHGMWSDLEDEHGRFKVRKHTIDMPPGTRRSYRVTADALGRWAYHCHLLYHMEAGMFRVVEVDEGQTG